MIEKLQTIIGQMCVQIAQLQAELEAARARAAELEARNDDA
jgi:cell division protein FtsB